VLEADLAGGEGLTGLGEPVELAADANSSPSRCPSTLDGSSHGSSPWSRSSPSASRPSGHTSEESDASATEHMFPS
jgi:hypothetical protein